MCHDRQQPQWEAANTASYAYLLGCYLGDGYINHKPPGTWTLRISCDPTYPEIESEIAAAMATTFPGARCRSHQPRASNVDVLGITHPTVQHAFPQHGRGPKHTRAIWLTDWQQSITTAHPTQLIRGLIHSDGCRTVNQVRTILPSGRPAEYSYVRYFFSNRSADIRGIFGAHCDLLGIRATQSNPRNMSVSSRRSVAIMEEIVGPKR